MGNLIVKERRLRLRFVPMVEMTLREIALIHQSHFEEVGEAYALDP